MWDDAGTQTLREVHCLVIKYDHDLNGLCGIRKLRGYTNNASVPVRFEGGRIHCFLCVSGCQPVSTAFIGLRPAIRKLFTDHLLIGGYR
jgi:hypothetical protein